MVKNGLHQLTNTSWSFAGMAVIIRLNFFTYSNLKNELDAPYASPPLITQPK
jgi:hypothetical protein